MLNFGGGAVVSMRSKNWLNETRDVSFFFWCKCHVNGVLEQMGNDSEGQ